MADNEKQFQVNITGRDETAGAFAAVEASFRQLGMTAEQVEAELKHLESVNEEDALAQHFRTAEVELRRLGFTSSAVQAEMDRLNKFKPTSAEELRLKAEAEHLSRYERLMNWFDSRGRKGEGEHEGGHGHEGGEHEGGEHRGHGWERFNTHINILRTHFGELNENIGETRESLAEMFPMLAGFGAIGSIAGMVELIHSTAEEQSQLEAMAKQLGITADQLENFHYSAKIADVPVESMDKAIGRLGISMADAASGHNKLDAALFKKMGISLKDARGHMEPIPKVLEEVSQALKNTADPAMRLYVAQELFGRSGRDMLPLLIQGREKLEDLNEEAEKLGPQLTELDRDHLEQFNDAWKQAQYVSESFMTKLGADLAPVMTPLLDDFTRYVELNKDWIAQDAAGAAKQFADAMKAFPWAATLKGTETFIHDVGAAASDVNSLVQHTVGWEKVLFLLAAYKLASPFAHIIGDAMRLGKAGYELTVMMRSKLPAATKVSEAEMGVFAEKSTAALAEVAASAEKTGVAIGGIGKAEAAAAGAFATSPLGKAMLAFTAINAGLSIYDAAHSYGNTPDHLNAAQQKKLESFHLQANQQLSASQIKQLDALGDPGEPPVEAHFDKPKEDALTWFRHLMGISDPADAEPNVRIPKVRGPFGRFAPPDQVDGSAANSAAADVSPSRDSHVTLHVQFDNAPPGMTVTHSTTGNVGTNVDVGYNQLSILGAGQM